MALISPSTTPLPPPNNSFSPEPHSPGQLIVDISPYAKTPPPKDDIILTQENIVIVQETAQSPKRSMPVIDFVPVDVPPEYPPRDFLSTQYDWPPPAERCWEFWKLGSCMGTPPTLSDGMYCVFCTVFCLPCMCSKMLAYSVDQECGILNHCVVLHIFLCIPGAAVVFLSTYFTSFFYYLFLWTLPTSIHCLIRHNLRLKFGVRALDPKLGWLGDFLMSLLCFPFAFLQEVRSMPNIGWDFWSNNVRINPYIGELKYIRRQPKTQVIE